jgi:hypothetical protein
MAEPVIPEDIARFVLENIDSVAQLEALLLMRNPSEQDWSVAALAARLYIQEEQTTQIVAVLRMQGVIRQTQTDPVLYRYAPDSPELGAMLDRVAEIYRRHLVPITNLIHSKPKPRIQQFADAFRIRKDN